MATGPRRLRDRWVARARREHLFAAGRTRKKPSRIRLVDCFLAVWGWTPGPGRCYLKSSFGSVPGAAARLPIVASLPFGLRGRGNLKVHRGSGPACAKVGHCLKMGVGTLVGGAWERRSHMPQTDSASVGLSDMGKARSLDAFRACYAGLSCLLPGGPIHTCGRAVEKLARLAQRSVFF